MCGIAGWFSPASNIQAEAEPRLQAMLAAITHRGPDGNGIWLDRHAALAHARLAIIDLDSGKQPMASGDSKLHLVYNGEIYNYRALRAELAAAGYPFCTHSDTEVILALYRHHGWQGFSRLRGMYAFALWDTEAQVGLLVRDPIGIKPLFYRHAGGHLAFASEAKGILAGGHRAELDTTALHLVMNFRYLPGEGSLFQGVGQLAPGEVLVWRPNDALQREPLPLPPVEPAPDLLDAIRQSVDLHMTADVEVGAYLSGGIDSATMVALAKGQMETPMHTFTLAVGDDPAEAANAARTAAILGVDNLCGEVSEPVGQSLPKLIRQLEVPKVNDWQISQLAQVAAGKVKVALSGLGGDELFYGYNLHRFLAKGDALGRVLPRLLTRLAGNSTAPLAARLERLPWGEPERALRILGSLGDWPRVYGLLRNVWDNPRLRRQIYGPRLLDAPLTNAFDLLRQRWPDEPDPVVAAARFEWRHKMVNDLLWQEDRCSMARGLEVRVPLVDQHLALAVGQYGRRQLMPGGRPKGMMRDLVAPILPDEVLTRPKSGFQVQAGQFFQRELAGLADIWLSEERIRAYGLFNPEFVCTVRAHPPAKLLRWHYFILYLMLGAHLWVEIFERGHEPSTLHH
jgi:asparagine synthase (glutamine-hydrolysing)